MLKLFALTGFIASMSLSLFVYADGMPKQPQSMPQVADEVPDQAPSRSQMNLDTRVVTTLKNRIAQSLVQVQLTVDNLDKVPKNSALGQRYSVQTEFRDSNIFSIRADLFRAHDVLAANITAERNYINNLDGTVYYKVNIPVKEKDTGTIYSIQCALRISADGFGQGVISPYYSGCVFEGRTRALRAMNFVFNLD